MAPASRSNDIDQNIVWKPIRASTWFGPLDIPSGPTMPLI